MKNIFIEGLQGAGKSTLMNYIAGKNPGLHICREGDYNPVDTAWCAYMSPGEYEGILKRYEILSEEIKTNTFREEDKLLVTYTRIITDVPGFHKDMESYELYGGRQKVEKMQEIVLSRYSKFNGDGYLFECAFFQNLMEEFLLFGLMEDRQVMAFYEKLFEKMDKQRFMLIYLHSENVEDNIRIIRRERSDESGNEMWYPLMFEYYKESPYGRKNGCDSFEDLIAYLERRQQLELRIMREIIGDNGVILSSKDWKTEEVDGLTEEC
ncbi:MAG: hypothetical protein IKL04_07000 [Lachnospiraceae bacterium]|nr:hypothetical protein [Lachnospiraceae bacterium]